MYIIGIDVGGTNTDAVLIEIDQDEKPRVINAIKKPTSADVFSGVLDSVNSVMQNVPIAAVMFGTTHFINALIQRKGLAKVCTIRLCGTASHAIPPMSNWPDDLKETVNGLTRLVSGGYFFDGSEIDSLKESEVRETIREALALNIQTFCISGIFSTCRHDQEKQVAEWIRQESPSAFITMSHEVAGLGLAERENAAILNASLRPLALKTIGGLETQFGQTVPFFLTKNDGTLLSKKHAIQWPVFTFASGVTNSMIGAAHLTGIKNAIVVDVGGTSTDIGVIINGKPRQTQANVRLVDDIRVNVSSADTISLPIGGGTVVHAKESGEKIIVGPDSVAFRLIEQGLAFGGQTMTLTDVALASGIANGVGNVPVAISSSTIEEVLKYVSSALMRNIDRMKTSDEPWPLILCGGGSIIIDREQTFPGISEIIRPDHFAVCNAIGAALCSVSATIDVIVDLVPSVVDGGVQREEKLRELKEFVYNRCAENGAKRNTIYLTELDPIPLAYEPGGCRHRVLLTAIGKLNLNQLQNNRQYQTSLEKPISFATENSSKKYEPPIQKFHQKDRPTFDEHGYWCIDETDIEYIAYGTGILGCGGGGESYHCKLWALNILREKKYSIKVVPYNYFTKSKELIGNIAFMGAPTVSNELLPSGAECLNALKVMEEYVGKQHAAVYSSEIGGSNGLMGLVVAALCGIPCVDCDGMGRAFPCLDHFLAFILGSTVTPASLCDIQNQTVICEREQVNTAKELEDFFRVECTKRGLCVAVCLPSMTGEEVEKYALHNSLSRAWFIGKAKFKSQTNPIDAVVKAAQGRVLISDGKVTNVERVTANGFVRGRVTITSQHGLVFIDFQNENLIVQHENGDVLATVPDLITLVESDSAEPLATEIVKYGYRVSILVLPAPGPLTTVESVKVLGPEAFGYHFSNYEYQANCAIIPSVWDKFYEPLI